MDIGAILSGLWGSPEEFWWTRLLLQRGLAATYLLAFAVVLFQFKPLLGERGLLPVPRFVKIVPFGQSPSLFHFWPTDTSFTTAGVVGLLLSVAALLGVSEQFGWAISAAVWFLLWILYLSFVNVGQTFYAFGWESMLLEAGFLAIFLGANSTPPSLLTILLWRWMLFRVMFGAGLIKLRGDPCWKKLTCLFYHHETQPMPNPLSWYAHHLPKWIHKIGVLYNHMVELVVPFLYFLSAPLAAAAGLLTLLFHGFLFVTGNYAFLGFLTMVIAVSTLSDRILGTIIPLTPPALSPDPVHAAANWALFALVAILSWQPVRNLLSPYQFMNYSFNVFHLVNTYGAFGSVTKERFEIVLEATDEPRLSDRTVWGEYEFKGKPTDPARIPPQVAPYHLRLDWLMWFEGIDARESWVRGIPYRYSPWFLQLVHKLLAADPATLSLLKKAPLGRRPPHFVRALLYHYRFTSPAERRQTGRIWNRELVDIYLPPVTLEKAPP